MSGQRIALIDMDGSVADYTGELERRLKLLAAPCEEPVNLHGHDWSDEPLHIKERMNLIKNNPGFWSKLPTMADGLEIVHVLHDLEFEFTILTKGPQFSDIGWMEKRIWCREYFPYPFKMSIVEDKSGSYGKVLVDDWPSYVEGWLAWRKRGLVIMPDRPWNQGCEHPQVHRYTGDASRLRDVIIAHIQDETNVLASEG